MFSISLYNKLFPVEHSIAIPFENYYISCFSTALGNKNHSDERKSFTVSYSMNSCGFSRQRALTVSAKINFNSLQKPNSALSILHSYGFTDTQIAAVVTKFPNILVAKENTILFKFQFFLSVGMSNDFLAAFISGNPRLLRRSLVNLIIPNYKFLKSFLLTDETVIKVMKRNRIYLDCVVERCFAPNIKILREIRVPESCIRLFLGHCSYDLGVRSSVFKDNVSKVLKMGFDPSKSTFVLAIRVVSKPVFDQCYETYSSWGWSKEDIYTAFRKHPSCMRLSQNNISRTLEYLVNEIGLSAKLIVQTPHLIFLSLERRMIPRLSVIQLLLSKGLIEHYNLSTVLSPTEKHFLGKFVAPYEVEIPELYEFYKGKIGVKK